MRNGLVLAALAVAAVAFVASCGRQDIEADKAALRALVEQDTVHFRSGTEGDSAAGDVLDDTTVGIWWRGPQTHPQPRIEVEVVDDSAWVGWHQSNYGELFHWIQTSDTTAALWVKELIERVQLNAVFRREGAATAPHRGWQLRRLSLAAALSDTVNTVRIDSLRIRSSLREILIPDPLNTYWRVDSLVTFTPGEQLTMTLYTNVPESFAFLHAFLGLLPLRLPFEPQGDGVHVGTWNAQLIPGPRFAIFDVITEATLLQRDAHYDFNGWLLLYRIEAAN